MAVDTSFTEEQQSYLQGFVAGCEALRNGQNLPGFADTLAASGGKPEAAPLASGAHAARAIHAQAQNRFLQQGLKLSKEEQAKRDKDPLEIWDEMQANAQAGRFPKGTDVFLYKFHGLFYVAPAQDAFMCRLRFHGGIANAHQFRGIAELAERYGGAFADVTTRANLQIREIRPEHATEVLTTLLDLGILNRGAGADNVRNITGAPTAGIDPQELIDTRPLSKQLHHYLLQHPEMYGLPRKFNIAFDGGGTVSTLADTNDLGFFAVRVADRREVPAGVYFRMELGGITGHKDFARDCGVLLETDQCVPVAAAVVRAFIEHGDRTDRTKARLKYVLDRLGLEKFLAETQRHLGFPLRHFPLEDCEPRGPVVPQAHIGVHPQKQPGRSYVGVVLPAGRIRAGQMRELAEIADRYGSGTIRLTVWQNLLISDIRDEDLPSVQSAIERTGLAWAATGVRSGLVACTGNGGCRFSASDTKGHALRLAEYLESRVTLDQPVNIHLTGCPHSCAQHYIGDIGLLATKVEVGEEMVEGYHVFVGGGYGDHREIGRPLIEGVVFENVLTVVEKLLLAWQSQRSGDDETFRDWSRSTPLDKLRELIRHQPAGEASRSAPEPRGLLVLD